MRSLYAIQVPSEFRLSSCAPMAAVRITRISWTLTIAV